MADEAPGRRWAVDDIQQTTRVTPSGRFEDVYEYTVATHWGGSFRVQVPVAIHTDEVAAGVIEAEYLNLERGRFLTG
jgi:hypothetical protein